MPVRRLRACALAATACLAVAAPAHASPRSLPSCRGAYTVPSARTMKLVRHATLCMIDRVRVMHGLRRLRDNRRLRVAARRHSRDMVARHYFDHVTPTGVTMVTRILRTRYTRASAPWTLGENLAWGTQRLATPAEIVRAWMHSPAHRENILFPRFREIGIGIARSVPSHRGPVATSAAAAGATYTTDFGARG